MKALSRSLFTAAAIMAFALPAMAADTYTLDASHTAITWHVDHFGFSTPSGKFMNVEGTVTLDEQNPAASSVNVTIQVADVISGVEKLDEHLKGPDFFDVAKYPTATFKSEKVEVTGKDTAVVSGTLTLRGVSKPVALNVKLNKLGENMMKQQTAGFTATARLKRSEFGMDKFLPGLGDDVRLDIESEANK